MTKKAMEVQAFIHVKRYGKGTIIMKKMKLGMNLQFFAEDTGSNGGGDNPDNATNEETNQETKNEQETIEADKKYSDEDVNKIIDAKFAKWKAEQQKEKDEAEKLAKMNADEKAVHERKKLEEKIAEYERKDSLHAMSKEASKMLSEADLPISEELLDLVTNEDAELTKQAVKTIVDFASKLIKANARQETPNDSASFSVDKNMSKAELAKQTRIIK